MKLFIWEDALRDYSPGLAFGYGETLEEVLSKFPSYVATQLGAPTKIIDCQKDKEIFATFVYGGG